MDRMKMPGSSAMWFMRMRSPKIAPPLKGEALAALRTQIDPAWEVIEEHHLARAFKFRNFVDALAFVNKVGALAEEQGHHPDIFLAWGKVRVELSTHKIGGLSESDFILAAKIDRL
jgi:4a-hydroxytetrahydrobiopterin dehydratase